MAGAGFRTFVDGDVLTAAQVNTYLMEQAVMVFADSSARASALPTPSEGMVTYLADTNVLEVYDGSNWVSTDDPNAIQNSIVDAKGDIITATADNTPARLAVGTNEHRLVADSAQSAGLKYVADTTNYAVAAKGDLLVGTAADTLTNVGVGTNGYVLTADSAETAGVKWAAATGAGKVLQVVSATYSTATSITSSSLTDSGLSATITPSAATSKILVLVSQVSLAQNNGGNNAGWGGALLRGSTIILDVRGASSTHMTSLQAVGATSTYVSASNSMVYLDSPNTTSATTYKTQGRVGSNTTGLFMNTDGTTSSMVLLEIGA